MKYIKDDSINLVVTSPPYPMIKMWDDIFYKMNNKININKNTKNSYELMHKELNKVWDECYRVLKQGGLMCINIGDATRSINKNFQLFSDHSTITEYLNKINMTQLTDIIWDKPSNAPNKFMGSGMLPTNAYITNEKEYILIFRKGMKRSFEEIETRNRSAYFWEERNIWFSDKWKNIKGIKQSIKNKTRDRSASFPIDIPFRLINMFSIYQDTILDPFLGMGTTTLAAILSGRNSIGVECEKNFKTNIIETIKNNYNKKISNQRLETHKEFVKERTKQNKHFKHYNKNYEIEVITKQSQNKYEIKTNENNDVLNFQCDYVPIEK